MAIDPRLLALFASMTHGGGQMGNQGQMPPQQMAGGPAVPPTAPPGVPATPPPAPSMGAPPGMAPAGPQGAMPPRPPMPGQPPMGGPQPPQMGQPMPPPPGAGGVPGSAQGGKFTPQEMAALGRMGDTNIAHLTPGEIEVPPQVQTPKVLADLKQAFANKKVPPQNFVSGSPTASHNPATGAQEFNIWSSLGPALGGAAGQALAPQIAQLLGLTPTQAAALGSGGLAALAAAFSGEGGKGAIMSGLGAAGGGYAANKAFGSKAPIQGADPSASGQNLGGVSQQGDPTSGMNIAAILGAAAGGGLGGQLGQPTHSTSPLPPGFNSANPYTGGNYQANLHQNSGNGLMPNFNGYNPYQVGAGGGFNFFPPQGQ